MTTKQELKDRLAARTNEVVELRREVNALNRELTAAQSNQARAIRERDEARAQLAAARADLAQAKAALTELRQSDAPGPRPFRVGDLVRVGPNPTYTTALCSYPCERAQHGATGRITSFDPWGDAHLDFDMGAGGWVNTKHLILIDPDESTPAPAAPEHESSARVVATYTDGTTSQFDADMVEVSDDGPVYEMFRGSAFVGCVSMMQVRSIAVVTR